MPEQFVFPLDQVDVWRPLPLPPADPAARAGYRVGVVARLARNVSPRDLTAALDEVSRRSSPPAQVVATGLAREDRPRLHENARPSRGGGRARPPHRVCQCCGAAARAIDRSPAGAGGEDGSRRAPVRNRTAIGAGGRDARRHRNRGWCAARVVAHTSRGPSCPGAIRRSGEPRGGGELARDCVSWRWSRRPVRDSVDCYRPLSRHEAMWSTCCLAASRRLRVRLACAACSSPPWWRWRACCSSPCHSWAAACAMCSTSTPDSTRAAC